MNLQAVHAATVKSGQVRRREADHGNARADVTVGTVSVLRKVLDGDASDDVLLFQIRKQKSTASGGDTALSSVPSASTDAGSLAVSVAAVVSAVGLGVLVCAIAARSSAADDMEAAGHKSKVPSQPLLDT